MSGLSVRRTTARTAQPPSAPAETPAAGITAATTATAATTRPAATLPIAAQTANAVTAVAARPSVHVRPLTPADAPALARLEAATYPRWFRAGARQLRKDLIEADWEDSNLGFGLFDGDELVGMFLVYYEPDCRRIFDYFDAPAPDGVAAEECLYVADFVVSRDYSRFTHRLLKEWWGQIRAYRGLPIIGFSTAGVLERWKARQAAFKRFGYRFSGAHRLESARPPHEIFLVRFEMREAPVYRVAPESPLRVEVIKTIDGWKTLEPHWDELLYETPDWTPFQTYAMQRIWWDHYAKESRPHIVVVHDGANVRAIAPLRIQRTFYWGTARRLLKFIGEHGEMDRPTILRRGEDREAVRAILEHVWRERDAWDALLFYEQPPDGLVLSLARRRFDGRLLSALVPGPACPWTDVTGSWQSFLAAKPRAFKKGLRRKLERLRKCGEVRFETCDSWPDVERAFDAYLDVEARSWKASSGVGVAKDAASLDYHRALVRRLGPAGKLHVRLLSLDGRPIAATFGVLDRGRFMSLHIVHDSSYDAFSPGVLLSAYELEQAYEHSDYEQYDLLGGFLNNKLTWTTDVRETVQYYVYRREPLFEWHFAFHFRIQPAMKRVLRRVGLMEPAMRAKSALRRLLLGRGGQADGG